MSHSMVAIKKYSYGEFLKSWKSLWDKLNYLRHVYVRHNYTYFESMGQKKVEKPTSMLKMMASGQWDSGHGFCLLLHWF